MRATYRCTKVVQRIGPVPTRTPGVTEERVVEETIVLEATRMAEGSVDVTIVARGHACGHFIEGVVYQTEFTRRKLHESDGE